MAATEDGSPFNLAEEVFELDAGAGFGVAVFDDDGAGERETPFLAGGVQYATGTGDDDGVFGDDQRLIVTRRIDGIAHEIVDWDGAIENGAGSEHGAGFNDSAFVDSRIPTNDYIIFNDNGQSADGFEYSTDLGARGDVAIAAYLRARTDQGVGIDHRVFTYVSSHIDEHRRHADYAAADMSAVANAGAARNDANTVGNREGMKRVGGFVKEGEHGRIDVHVHDGTHSKAEEDSLFHPGVDAPTRGGSGIGFRSANLASIECFLKG